LRVTAVRESKCVKMANSDVLSSEVREASVLAQFRGLGVRAYRRRPHWPVSLQVPVVSDHTKRLNIAK
jgi:hypothetical protein